MRSSKSQLGLRATGMMIVAGFLVTALACGGSGSSNNNNNNNNNNQVIAAPGPNVVTLTADAGPANLQFAYLNGAFVTVQVCVPGSATNCNTIDHVLVDTGSYGLRVLATGAAGGEFNLALPQVNDSSGNAVGECVQFIDGSFLWGPVQTADVIISGEKAGSVPIHVVGDTNFTGVPISCSVGGTDRDSLQQLGANGILGVGGVQYDCGPGCVSGTTPPTPVYYTCPSTGCAPSFLPLAQQIQNPVALFATDNNGVIVELPGVPSNGAAKGAGALVFGIGTQSNNSLGSASVLTLDNILNFTTNFNGTGYNASFLDSGSNGLYFLDSTTTGIPTCSDNSSFYCPSSTQNLTASNLGQNGTSTSVGFSVANADTLFQSQTAVLFNNVAGPGSDFDWGLPFFFGRNVFVSIAGKTAPGGTTPYVAY